MLDTLPVEVLEMVLSCDAVAMTDIASVAVTCSRLHSIVADSNELWRNKFKQRFSDLMPVIGVTADPWQEWYKRAVLCSRDVRIELDRMLTLYYQKEHVSNEAFMTVAQLLDEYPHGYEIVVLELTNIMTKSPLHDNLTIKYYAEKMLSFVKQIHLRTVWQEFVKLPASEQSIEKGAILIAQWFQPAEDLSEYRDFKMPLDVIARVAKSRVRFAHPDHPLTQRLQLVDDEFLAESLWTPQQCHQVLICLSELLYEELGFHGANDDYYAPENSYLNLVLERKTGIPITLCVVYMSIARRLGVVLEPVAFPTHFFLRFCERPNHPDPSNRYTYVDAYNCGQLMSRSSMRCPYAGAAAASSLPRSSYEAAEPLVVIERMVRNLVEAGRRQGGIVSGMYCLRYGLQLLVLLRPNDIESILLLARVYLHLGINLKEVLTTLQEVLVRDPTQTALVAHMYKTCKSQLNDAEQQQQEQSTFGESQRPPCVTRRPADGSVRYAVGMAMKHEQYNYSCVIFGWDPQCSASREWITQMGVNQLADREFQPFYNVLVADGSIRYAAQENLRVDFEPQFIDHPYLGKYFTSFDGVQFVPNDEKRREYPDDEAIRNEIRSNFLIAVPKLD